MVVDQPVQVGSGVSVIIPAYNRRAYVIEAIDSALAQTLAPREIIVIDDGSTDGTGEALMDRYGDRIRYRWQENKGESAARNHGVEMARGEFVALLDSDDLWLPEKLERQTAFLRAGGYDMVSCSATHVDRDGRDLAHAPIPIGVAEGPVSFAAMCLQDSVQSGSTAILRRDIFQNLGGFDEEIQLGEDWDMWMRVAKKHTVGHLSIPLAKVRVHDGSQWGWGRSTSPGRIDGRLSAEKRMFTRLFSDATAEDMLLLRDKVMANSLRRAAVMDYAIGRTKLGCQRMAEAHMMFPDHEWDELRFAQELMHSLRANIEATDHPLRLGDSLVRKALLCWPSDIVRQSRIKRWMYAELAESLFFSTDRRPDLGVAFACWVRSVVARPRLLTNRGAYVVWAREVVEVIGEFLRHDLSSSEEKALR